MWEFWSSSLALCSWMTLFLWFLCWIPTSIITAQVRIEFWSRMGCSTSFYVNESRTLLVNYRKEGKGSWWNFPSLYEILLQLLRFSYMWRGINYALCSRTSFTWVRKSEPFCIFQHTNSSISSGLVLRIAGIWRETSCYRDDSTDHPRNSDRKNDLGKDNTHNKEWVSKQEAILKWLRKTIS